MGRKAQSWSTKGCWTNAHRLSWPDCQDELCLGEWCYGHWSPLRDTMSALRRDGQKESLVQARAFGILSLATEKVKSEWIPKI